jgi:hypothetical protein
MTSPFAGVAVRFGFGLRWSWAKRPQADKCGQMNHVAVGLLVAIRHAAGGTLTVIAGLLGLQSPDLLANGLVSTTSLPQRRTPDYCVATTT